MKRILAITIFVLVAMFIIVPVVLAQDTAPDLPDTAVGGVNWLLAHIDGTTAWVLGLVSMVVASVVNKFIPDKNTGDAVVSSVRFAVAAVVPAGLTWLYTSLLPVAEQLDSSGLWSVFLAIFGTATVWHLTKTRLLDPVGGVLESWSEVLSKA